MEMSLVKKKTIVEDKINEYEVNCHVGRAMFGPTLKKYLHFAQAITQTEWLKSS